MRDPALHIRKSNLLTVLSLVGIEVTEAQLTSIFIKSKPYQIRNRSIVQGSTKQSSQALKMVSNESPDIDRFQRILVLYRQEQGHKFVQVIDKGHRDYPLLKEIALAARTFTETFKIDAVEEGYKQFIQLGFHFMGRKYGLNKFKTYLERIFELYENLTIVEDDIDKDGTAKLYEEWKECMLSYAALDKQITAIDMVHMVFARQEADENGAYYDDWIISQFEGLVWADSVPELSQLYGLGAKKRYESYVAAQGYAENREPEKDDLPVKFNSEAEEQYYRNLRTKNSK